MVPPRPKKLQCQHLLYIKWLNGLCKHIHKEIPRRHKGISYQGKSKKAKLQSCMETSKVKYVMYSAHTLEVKDTKKS